METTKKHEESKAKKAKVDETSCFWLDDEGVLNAIRRIENIAPARLKMIELIGFYQEYPKHPIVLACLAESISKVFGGIEACDAMEFFRNVKRGKCRWRLLVRDVAAKISDVQESKVVTEEERIQLLPSGISGETWANAIGAILDAGGCNSAYCCMMGSGVTKVADFVRLARPLENKCCTTADLVPLFRHLWANPEIEGGEWTDEMITLHDKYMSYIDTHRWLDKAFSKLVSRAEHSQS